VVDILPALCLSALCLCLALPGLFILVGGGRYTRKEERKAAKYAGQRSARGEAGEKLGGRWNLDRTRFVVCVCCVFVSSVCSRGYTSDMHKAEEKNPFERRWKD